MKRHLSLVFLYLAMPVTMILGVLAIKIYMPSVIGISAVAAIPYVLPVCFAFAVCVYCSKHHLKRLWQGLIFSAVNVVSALLYNFALYLAVSVDFSENMRRLSLQRFLISSCIGVGAIVCFLLLNWLWEKWKQKLTPVSEFWVKLGFCSLLAVLLFVMPIDLSHELDVMLAIQLALYLILPILLSLTVGALVSKRKFNWLYLIGWSVFIVAVEFLLIGRLYRFQFDFFELRIDILLSIVLNICALFVSFGIAQSWNAYLRKKAVRN